jgi:hypothetical protein
MLIKNIGLAITASPMDVIDVDYKLSTEVIVHDRLGIDAEGVEHRDDSC